MDALTGVRVSAQLETLRTVGDVAAEAMIDSLAEHIGDTQNRTDRRNSETAENPVTSGHSEWFRALASPRFVAPIGGSGKPRNSLPDAVDKFLYGQDPDFDDLIDVQKVRHAQRFFETYGLHISAALLHQSLPEAYACARGAQVLYLTSEMVSHPARRIRETAQMLIVTMSEDATIADNERQHTTTLHPGRAGAVIARRVRLFHEIVRKMFSEDSEGALAKRWESRAEKFELHGRPILGRPINQEDQLGTLFTFTVSVFEALGRLGVPYNQDDMDAWFHVWDIVGRHLGVGVESALAAGKSHKQRPAQHDIFGMQLTPNISSELMAVIRRRHQEESHEGKILTNALLQEVQRPLSRSMKPLPAMLVRYLVGNDLKDMLGVRSGGWSYYWANQLLSTRQVSRVAIGRPTRFSGGELSAMMGREILQMFTETSPLNVFDGNQRGGVELPDGLCRSWGIHGQAPLNHSSEGLLGSSESESTPNAVAL